MAIKLAKFKDVANGTQAGQFGVGEYGSLSSINDLDPIYRQLLDKPIACTMAVMDGDGRPNLTPMLFDYKDDKVLINLAQHRKKTTWIRKTPKITLLLMNPENMYHLISLKVSVEREILEDDPKEGAWVTEQVNGIWKKYIGEGGGPEYGLRDPAMNERRVLMICKVDSIATFGQPC